MVVMFTSLFDNLALVNVVQHVLFPHLLREHKEPQLRLWSVGCEIGDEAHLLVLLLADLLGPAFDMARLTIFATDADSGAVRQARHYCYPKEVLSQEPMAAYRHLLQTGNVSVGLLPSLRKHLCFAPHSLIRHAPFPHLDLVLCHTSLSSFSFAQQAIILSRFAFALTEHSLLVLLNPEDARPDPILFHQKARLPLSIYLRSKHPVEPTSLSSARSYPVLLSSKGAQTASSRELSLPSQTPPSLVLDEAAEVYLEELQTTLEEREVVCGELEERTAALEQASRDLEAVSRLKDEFLSLVSHEMRTPLTTLLTTAQMLERRLVHPKQPEVSAKREERAEEQLAEDLSTIVKMGRQIATLLTDLVDAAHLHSDLFHLTDMHPVDLVVLIERLIKQHILLSGRSIRFVTPSSPCMGIWDETRVSQVLGNLLTNALKYSVPETEVVVQLRRHFVGGSAQEVLISIQDQGQGISKENLPYVFDRFYRASLPDDDPHARESLGLGLYIAAEIVKRHGGHIWVESVRGVGSTFFITLPLHRTPASQAMQKTEAMHRSREA
jgi:signal transduction histidine kinase